MKSPKFIWFPIVLFVLNLGAGSLNAAIKYWDTNGVNAGSGQGITTVTWNTTGAFWSTDSTGASATTLFASGDTAVFSAGTDATGAFTVNTPNQMTAGGLTIDEGTVSFTGAGAILGTSTVTIATNATLSIPNSVQFATTTGAVMVINGGTLKNTAATTAGSFCSGTFSTMTLNGASTLNFPTVNILSILNSTPKITGVGPLIKSGVGVLALVGGGGNDYSGGTIVNMGELRCRTAANCVPTNTDLTVTRPGIFNLNDISTQIGSLTGNGDVGLASGTLTVGGTTSPAAFTGGIKDTANSGATPSLKTGGKLFKSGSGTLSMSGSNDFTGSLTLNGGTITLNPPGFLCGATSDLIVNSGTLNLNNAAQTVKNISGTGGVINLGTNHILTSIGTNSCTFSGKLSGSGSFVYNTPGFVQTFAGVNDYTGGTTVKAGTLEVKQDGGLGSGNVSILDNATLQLDGGATNGYIAPTAVLLMNATNSSIKLNFIGTNTIHALSFDGGATYQAPGVYGAVGSGAPSTSSLITGTGLLNVATGPTPLTLAVTASGTNAIITWNGTHTLQTKTNVVQSWTDLPGSLSPYTNPVSGELILFQLKN